MPRFATPVAWSACLIGLLGAGLGLLPLALDVEEDPGLRWLFALRGAVPAPDSVTVVGISRDTADALGVSSDLDEWPRSLHAALIERLTALGADTIVFDLMFAEPGDVEDDEQLARAIEDAGNVMLLEWVDTPTPEGLPSGAILEVRQLPHEPFTRAALATAPFTLPTRPLRTSQFWAFGHTDDSVPNLPAVALQAHALSDYEYFVGLVRDAWTDRTALDVPASAAAARRLGLPATVRALRQVFEAHPGLAERISAALAADPAAAAGPRRLALALLDLYAGPSTRYLNFYGPARTIATIPFEQLVGPPSASGLVDLRGHVVFVGYSELRQPVQSDDFISAFSEASGLNLSGVEIGATAFANLLERTSLEPLPRGLHLLWLLVWGAGVTWLLVRLRTSIAIGLALALGGVLIAFAWWRLEAANEWWPFVVPLAVQLPAALCVVAYLNYRQLSQQRERIQTALGYYVPGTVLARLVKESAERGADRQLVYGTCLVSDAERFTTLSEQLRADALGELMEDYYRTLAAAAERHGGFIADVSGDSIVAVWTAVRSQTEPRRQACAAALDMRAAIDAFNRDHAPRKLPTGFGLDSGEVLVGNIGIAQRYQYRAVGDIVNTASRIQGLNRLLGTQVLASAATLESIGTGLASRPLGRFLLVGKSMPISVHEVLGEESREPSLDAAFQRGLRAFAERRWDAARAAFEEGLDLRPDDGPSRFYLEQCARYAAADLPADWDGTVQITVK